MYFQTNAKEEEAMGVIVIACGILQRSDNQRIIYEQIITLYYYRVQSFIQKMPLYPDDACQSPF